MYYSLYLTQCHLDFFTAVPGAPEAPTVSEIFRDSCLVAWQPPTEDGGAPIIGYHVERRTGTSKRWVRITKELVPESSLQVAELVEDNQYKFRVAAENRAGLGEFSAPSQPITAKDPWRKPDKPGQPQVSDIAGTSLCLTWKPPGDDGGAEITAYTIEVRRQGSAKWQKHETEGVVSGTEYAVTGLEEDTEYEWRVAAENKAGLGPFSAPSPPVKTLIGMLDL